MSSMLILISIYLLSHISSTDCRSSQGTVSPSCYDGAYQVSLPPFDECSGFRKCGLGHYCVNGVRNPCPAGTYGSSVGLNSTACSGPCSPGFYCPPASTIATVEFCGEADVYCPEGSGSPLAVPDGYYSIDADSTDSPDTRKSRSAIRICPIGSYCENGLRFACKGGTYGNSIGLKDGSCSGVCPEGWYCPPLTRTPVQYPCSDSPTQFCPIGSSRPNETAEGYFAVNSHRSEGGGFGGQMICPRGSFCQRGERFLCPAGHYGAIQREINASCTGLCTAGYYCPAGSISSKQIQCDFTDRYCPEGSALPIQVSLGFYTAGFESIDYTLEVINNGENIFQELAPVTQKQCEPGFYCLADGIKRKCPLGRFGNQYGLSSPACSGFCSAGYYCEEGSPVDKQFECGGVDKFCPPGSAQPQQIFDGYYTIGGGEFNRSSERRCEPGFYCSGGIKRVCDAGSWGGTFGLNDSSCSGKCSAGYYCPLGSISPTEIMCGDPSRYCPEGSVRPTAVSVGYYSTGGNDSTRFDQAIAPPGHYAVSGLLYVCPAGYYGASSGLSSATCSGACSVPGYYCPSGSTSAVMRYCGGDDRFCPPFTVAPIKVHEGFYTADYLYETCAPGTWRDLSIPPRTATDNINSAIVTSHPLRDCQLCPDGFYKAVAGDELQLCRRCEAVQSVSAADRITCDCLTVREEGFTSFFNITTALCDRIAAADIASIDASMWDTNTSLTRYQQFPCDAGHYCTGGLRYKCPPGRFGSLQQETRPLCEGSCSRGYFCLQSSTSPMSFPCGDAKYICPDGSFSPLLVPAGYYSNEDEPEQLRYFMTACPVGFYCPGDGRRYPCSAGSFTDQEGTVEATCMGVCDRGHYCLEASPSRTQFACGNSSVYCPRGSSQSTLVLPGFYGVFSGPDAGEQGFWDTGNTTFSLEIPCEPGYYCIGGIKYPCPPGTFGWRHGMTSSTCGGLCARGYYCPSYSAPQPDAPSFAVFPLAPHLSAAELECGDVEYYCPQGAVYPLLVGGGNYSIGGSSTNRTRYAQLPCPPGSYCNRAIPYLCPAGFYGNTYGLLDSSCTAPCPPGFYCPPGTVDPLQCPETQFATGFASTCSSCPGGRTTPLLCQTEKSCCFRG